MATQNIFLVIHALGIVSFLIYGMGIMKRSLEKANGSLFERALNFCTRNDLSAVLFGTVITAIVQSSSAITVTVVGLVDAGALKLRRAIGVILGANVGTCVTSWLLSLTGVKEDHFLLSFLKADNLACAAAFCGLLLFFSKAETKKEAGKGLIGFGLLLFSVDRLSEILAPLSENEGFRRLFLLFENPLFGILAGTLVTAVLQSSSASIGILQAISRTGSVSVAAAIPIILGQNIGTTVTALIASTGTSLNARRSAFVHFYINLLGATVFLVASFLLSRSSLFSFRFHAAVDPAGIAGIHTFFNVISTVALYPFIGLLEKTALEIGREKAKA